MGAEIAGRYRVLDHLSKDRSDMVEVAGSAGMVPALVNRITSPRISRSSPGSSSPTSGPATPGGASPFCPASPPSRTLQYMHGPRWWPTPLQVRDLEGKSFPRSGVWRSWGMTGADFVVNVTLDTRSASPASSPDTRSRRTLQGCRFLARHWRSRARRSPGFHRDHQRRCALDCNLYQTVKGLPAPRAP